MLTRYTTEAPVVWKLLNGVICVYKPLGVNVYDVREKLISNIAEDLNQMKCRPPRDHLYLVPRPSGEIKKIVRPSFADNTLVVGPRYLPNDIRCTWATHLGKGASGVFVLGINSGAWRAKDLHMSRPVRVYHACGRLGIATDTYDTNGKVVERSKYEHVKQSIMDRVLASVQAAHQKHMFEYSGVDIQSQAAYELAVQGTFRPPDGRTPFLYSIKCVHFEPPDFTLEIKCINENESYLKTLVHDIGIKVHSAAACSSVRCVRYGPFTLEHALLRRHWRVPHLMSNMTQCHKVLEDSVVQQPPASLVSGTVSSQLLSEQQ